MHQLQPRELAAVLDDMADHRLFTRDSSGNPFITEASCPSPSAADVRAILLEVVASTNPRPGDAVARIGLRLRSAETHGGLSALVDEGVLTDNGRSYVVTEAGYRLLNQ